MTTEQLTLLCVYILTGIVGLCVGSFLNVVIYRVPLHMNIAFPASHCPKCNSEIAWYDNIPVLSYILLHGKCRHCKDPISPRYTIVELANMLLWLACAWCFWEESIPYAICAMLAMSLMLCVFFIDLEHMIIMDRFQIMLLALGVVMTLFDLSVIGSDLLSHLIGFAVGLASFWFIAFLGEKILKKEALGGGDIKLAAVMGLILGWQKLLLAVLLASVAGSVVLLALKAKDKQFPFAPFLTSGFAIALLFGDFVIYWYFALIVS